MNLPLFPIVTKALQLLTELRRGQKAAIEYKRAGFYGKRMYGVAVISAVVVYEQGPAKVRSSASVIARQATLTFLTVSEFRANRSFL